MTFIYNTFTPVSELIVFKIINESARDRSYDISPSSIIFNLCSNLNFQAKRLYLLKGQYSVFVWSYQHPVILREWHGFLVVDWQTDTNSLCQFHNVLALFDEQFQRQTCKKLKPNMPQLESRGGRPGSRFTFTESILCYNHCRRAVIFKSFHFFCVGWVGGVGWGWGGWGGGGGGCGGRGGGVGCGGGGGGGGVGGWGLGGGGEGLGWGCLPIPFRVV